MKIPSPLSLALLISLFPAPWRRGGSAIAVPCRYPARRGHHLQDGRYRPAHVRPLPSRRLEGGGPPPAVVFIHGGAWIAGDGKVFFPHARYFASRGAVTFSIEYRLEKADGSPLANCFTDCKSAMRYIRGHAGELGIDPDKIAAFGDSAGGHLAAALGTCEGFDDPADDIKVSARPNAMVLCNPIVDMTEGTWIKFVMRGAAMAKGATLADMHPSDDQLKLAHALSPLSNIKPGEPPAILMHGTNDNIVNPEQAREFAAAYTKAGDHCDLVWMQGSRHAFVVARYSAPEPVVVDAIRHADAFLASLGWLTGPPTLEASNPPAWVVKKK